MPGTVYEATERLSNWLFGRFKPMTRYLIFAAVTLTGLAFLAPRVFADEGREWYELAGIFCLALGFLTLVGEMQRLVRETETLVEAPIDQKLRSLTDSLETVRKGLEGIRSTMPELEAELDLKTAAINRLQAETERLDRLAELKKIETAAIEEVIRTAQLTAARPARQRELLFLLIGLLFSVPLSVAANFVYDAMK